MKKQIGILSNIGKLFNFKACISYYYSYIYSKLNYCIIVWGGVLIAHGYSNKLKKVHNRLVKLLFGRFFSFKHSYELFAPLKFLKLIDIYRYNVMITLYKINNNNIIPFMFRNFVSNNFQHGYNTRRTILRVPICAKFSMLSFNFVFRAIQIFNDIPEFIKNIRVFSSFKKALKDYFIDSY